MRPIILYGYIPVGDADYWGYIIVSFGILRKERFSTYDEVKRAEVLRQTCGEIRGMPIGTPLFNMYRDGNIYLLC